MEAGERRAPRASPRARLVAARQVLDGRATGRRRPDVRPGRLGVRVPQRPLSRPRRHRGRSCARCTAPIPSAIARGHRARRRMGAGPAKRNGGWGAFDADNTHHYLNNIPFADHGALLDPPTADLTARCISDAGPARLSRGHPAMARRSTSCARAGAGRLLVRPLGPELHLRHLVGAVRAQRRRRGHDAPYVRKAVDWLIARQNETAAGARAAPATGRSARTSRSRARPRRPPGRCSA